MHTSHSSVLHRYKSATFTKKSSSSFSFQTSSTLHLQFIHLLGKLWWRKLNWKTCDADCLPPKLYIWMTTRWCGAAASSELQLWPFFFSFFFYHEESKTSPLSITWGITCRRLVYFVWTSWMRLLYLGLLNVIICVDYLFV